jgi:hypothetical protein
MFFFWPIGHPCIIAYSTVKRSARVFRVSLPMRVMGTHLLIRAHILAALVYMVLHSTPSRHKQVKKLKAKSIDNANTVIKI